MKRRLWIGGFGLLFMLMMGFMASAAVPVPAPPDFAITFTFTPPSQEAPKPIIVLTIYDPWKMVIGSDEPTFALYDTGLVIYQRENEDGDWEFASVKLDEDELQSLRESLHIDESLYAMDDDYSNVMITDQPSNRIQIFDAELGEKNFWIYGSLRFGGSERSEIAPQRVVDLYDVMAGFTREDAKTWLPGYFEVILWPFETSTAAAWPTDWPGLDDPTTVQRDTVYSIYVDIEEYDRFRELADDANAFRLDGQTWAFSVRFPLPHEYYVYKGE